MHHQQELQLNNPKINSDIQLCRESSCLTDWINLLTKLEMTRSTLAGYSWPWQLESSRARNRICKYSELSELISVLMLVTIVFQRSLQRSGSNWAPDVRNTRWAPAWSQPGLRGLTPRQHSDTVGHHMVTRSRENWLNWLKNWRGPIIRIPLKCVLGIASDPFVYIYFLPELACISGIPQCSVYKCIFSVSQVGCTINCEGNTKWIE